MQKPRSKFFAIRIFELLFIFSFVLPQSFAGSADKGHIIDQVERASRHSQVFGEKVPGVVTRLDTDQRVVALTLDLCSGSGPRALDRRFVNFLVQHQIKATLFASGLWLNRNRALAKSLSASPLFEIENHGYHHRPATRSPRRVYGISSTPSLRALYREIARNAALIGEITGRPSTFYRSGTATYDLAGVQMAEALGHEVAGFDVVSGDAAHPYSRRAILRKLNKVVPGSIVLMHLNQPSWEGFEAFRDFYLAGPGRYYTFVHLHEFPRHRKRNHSKIGAINNGS